jgi:hypothetical protein
MLECLTLITIVRYEFTVYRIQIWILPSASASVAAYLAQTVDSDIGCTVCMGGALEADDNWRHARSGINSPPRALRMRPAQYI